METNEIKALIEEQGKSFAAFQAKHEERMKELEGKIDNPKPRTLSAENKANGPVFYDRAGNPIPSFKAADPWPVEGENLSVGKTFRGLITGRWDGAEKEFKAVSGTTGGAGGVLLPAPVASQIIAAVRNRLSIVAAGASTIKMEDRSLTLAKVLIPPAAAVYDEEETIDEASVTFGAVKLEAKKYACIVPASRELIEDAANLEETLINEISRSIALKVDADGLASLLATLEAIPLTPNVTAIASSFGYDDILGALYTLYGRNVSAPITAITHPRVLKALAIAKEATTNAYLTPPTDWGTIARIMSAQVPVTGSSPDEVSALYLGNFGTGAVFGIRQDVSIEISNTAGNAFSKHQTLIKCLMRCGFRIIRADDFQVITAIPV
jgi:HK97 family phage major capsid protein